MCPISDVAERELTITVTSDAHETICGRRSLDCRKVAMWLGTFGPYGGWEPCSCDKDRQTPYCQEHADQIRRAYGQGEYFECDGCRGAQRLLSMEPLRL